MMSRDDRSTTWVQPIVVDARGTHTATVQAAALASVRCWQSQDGPWQSWLAGPFTKTVRRAKPSQVDALAKEPGATCVTTDGGRAVGFPPVQYGNMPRTVSRLQVSGTNLARDAVFAGDPASRVIVAVRADLTTGKACAQAAHALFAWALLADLAPDDDPLAAVSLVSAQMIDRIAALRHAVVIRDKGLTEVDPNTLTAVAVTR
ncbi:MAG: hypothetical protein FWE61_01800 [Micrococcales bacterium]|nr:hypothetical protein [Micrococcales bacterium]